MTHPIPYTWEHGEPHAVEIAWQQFEVVVPIDKDRELTGIEYSLNNTSDIEVYFDDLKALKNLMNDKLLANNIIFMPIEEVADGTPFSMIVYGAVELSEIVKVSYVPEQNIIPATNFQLQMKHTITQDLICTKTFLPPSENEAGIVTDFGPISQASEILAGNSVTFYKSNVGKLPKGILIIQWDII